MKRLEIIEIVVNIIEDYCGTCDNIYPDTRLKDDLGIDSLSLVSIIIDVEEKIGVTFDVSELDPSKIIDVRSIVDLEGKSL